MVDQKKKRPLAPAEKTRTEEAVELFAMAHVGGDRNQKVAAGRLRAMSSDQRRELRQSIQRLDYLLDDVSLELLAKSSRNE